MISLKLKCLRLFFPGDFNRYDTGPLNTQTSGKRAFLRSNSGCKILKPYPRRSPLAEEDFYKWINDESRLKSSPDIKNFVPAFYGTIVTKHFSFVVLEDVTRSFKCPSVADVKIGAHTWTPTDCFMKVIKEKLLYPLGRSLGFRITGVKMFVNSSNKFKKISFYEIRKLSPENLLLNVVMPFFSHENGVLRVNVIQEVLKRLATIKEWFLSKNDRFHFYSSSILIVFETSNELLLTNEMCRVDVRMIDFAHVVDFATHSPSSKRENEKNSNVVLDSNYLNGLQNFMHFLTLLIPPDDDLSISELDGKNIVT